MKVRVSAASDLSDGEKKFLEVDGVEVAVINVDGEYFSIRNFCPHMEGPLARGPVFRDDDSPMVECPFHGWTFDLETGASTFDSRQRIRTYDVVVEDGVVFLDV